MNVEPSASQSFQSPPPAGTLVERLARLLQAHPHQWLDGLMLGNVAGSYAWRSRVSDLRKPPFGMTIENRQRRVRTASGMRTVSEYRYVPNASVGAAQ